jgi:hypothetical protein
MGGHRKKKHAVLACNNDPYLFKDTSLRDLSLSFGMSKRPSWVGCLAIEFV